MLPLRYVAMGLLVVFLRADFGGYDALADPVGWALVLGGLWRLRRTAVDTQVLTWLAGVALLAAAATYPPSVGDRLEPSGQWALSLPQLAFCILWCGAIIPCARDRTSVVPDAAGNGDRGHRRARWLQLLRWVFVALAVGPVLVLGGHVDALTTPLAVLAVGADLALVYLTFAVSGTRTGARQPAE